MYLVMLLLVPLLIGLVAHLMSKGKITLLELIIQEAVMVLVIGIGVSLAFWQSTTDTEFLNGRIVSKEQKKVSCEHSYDCFCYTTCDSEGSCTEHCQTCYEHSYDMSWLLHTNVKQWTISISRIDRQGLKMPPRWGTAYAKEPVTFTNKYTNYIKASPDTVLRRLFVSDELLKRVPEYPKPYDHYRANKFWSDVPVSQPASWQWLLNELNADLGNVKQVNVHILVTSASPEFEYAVEERWIGGKQNDVVVLIGSADGKQIQWVRVLSWSLSQDLKVVTRDQIMALASLDRRDAILGTIRQNVQQRFVRRPMEDFKYLALTYQPSGGTTIFLFLLGVALSIGITWFMHENEFEDGSLRPKHYRY